MEPKRLCPRTPRHAERTKERIKEIKVEDGNTNRINISETTLYFKEQTSTNTVENKSLQ